MNKITTENKQLTNYAKKLILNLLEGMFQKNILKNSARLLTTIVIEKTLAS